MIIFGCNKDWPGAGVDGAGKGGEGRGGSVDNAPGAGEPGMKLGSGIGGTCEGPNCCGETTDGEKPLADGIPDIPPTPAWGAEFGKTLMGD